MTMTIRVSDIVYVDLKFTPKSLVDKAIATAKLQHSGVWVEYLPEIEADSSSRGGRVEIFKALFTKGEAEGWRKGTKEAMTSVADTKQTLVCELHRLRELVQMLKDVYGFEPIEGGG